MQRKQNAPNSWWECKLVQPLWKTVCRFLKKLKIGLPYGPQILLLGMHTEKPLIWKDTCTPMFKVVWFAIAKTGKQPKSPSTHVWIKKMLYIASLVAQTVKNLPAMWETQVQSLSWEDPLEKEMKPTPVFLPGEFHGQKGLEG